jgi:hypothetical protein
MMPSPPPDPEIQFWFTQLGRFQAACISNSAAGLNLLQFANANIVSTLNSPNTQKNFLTAVAASTGYDDLQISDLTTYKTFGGLLNYCRLLENDIFRALQALSAPEYQTINSTAYYATPVASAFPGGSPGPVGPGIGGGLAGPSTGPRWMSAQDLLMASMDPSCYTLAFRIKVNAAADKPGAKMSDVLPLIAGLG